jgi:hypothetical protein
LAEQFHRGRARITFSGGAIEAMYAALVVLGERGDLQRTSEGRAVIAWLREELARGQGRVRAFRLDPVEPALAEPNHLRVVATLVGELAHVVAAEEPDAAVIDVVWDRELRLSWLARLEVLHELVADAHGGCAPLVLALDPQTGAEVDAERFLWGYRHVKAAGVLAETIAHIDRTLALLGAAQALQRRAPQVYGLMSDKAALLAKAGRRREAAKVLCEAVQFVEDPELVSVTLEYARALERQDP